MKVLLTGANGFVGRHLAASMPADWEVVSLTRDGVGTSAAAGLTCVGVDLAGVLDVFRLPDWIDAVVMLAQSPRYRDFPAGAPDMFAVNTASVAQLLDYAVAAGAQAAVLASTGAVYEPFDGPMRETCALAPRSFYAASKLAAEVLLHAYGEHLAPCALRLFFPYGPGQTERLIPDLAARIRDRRPVQISGPEDGNRLTPTYVEDVVSVIRAALDDGWRGTVNVASPEPVSIRDLALRLGDWVGREPVFEHRPDAPAVDIVPCTRKLATLFDLSRFHSLDEGLRATVAPG